ncbi:monofunctional biosynthetic peptidoglycan transglycosylase [bacterium]|nr:monofunctional biosynthetic peptidoglycan transglycosylase [bacterium]
MWGGWTFWSSQFPDVRILRSQFPVVVPVASKAAIKVKPQSFSIRWSARRPDSWVSLSAIAPSAVEAVIVSEDAAYFSHPGYDVREMREALKHDLEKGEFARGASTITQQVAKNVFLNQEKSLWRKAKELFLAVRMSREVGKRRVLETYFNIVEWGPGIFGIQAASAAYFGKSPALLTAREGAFLAMLLPSPVRYSQSFRQRRLTPFARKRISQIIRKMLDAGYLTAEEAVAAMNERMSFEQSEPMVPPDGSDDAQKQDEEIDQEAQEGET